MDACSVVKMVVGEEVVVHAVFVDGGHQCKWALGTVVQRPIGLSTSSLCSSQREARRDEMRGSFVDSEQRRVDCERWRQSTTNGQHIAPLGSDSVH